MTRGRRARSHHDLRQFDEHTQPRPNRRKDRVHACGLRPRAYRRCWLCDRLCHEIVKYKKAIEKGAADKATHAEYKWWMEYARKAFCDAAPFWSPKLAAMAVRADVTVDDMRKDTADPRQRLLEMYLQMRQRARLPKIVEGNSTLPPKQIEQKAVEIDDHGDGELDRDDQDDQNA
jgi:hypothetical protein